MEEENIFPVVKECRINIQSATGDNWGGLDHLFNEKELTKEIHTVTVSLFNGFVFDYNGKLDNYCENGYLIGRFDEYFSFFNVFEIAVLCNCKIDTSDNNSLWFLYKQDAVKFAKELRNHLIYLGWKPRIQK